MQTWILCRGCRPSRWIKILLLTLIFVLLLHRLTRQTEELSFQDELAKLNIIQKHADRGHGIDQFQIPEWGNNSVDISKTGTQEFPYRYLINEENACSEKLKIINVMPVAAKDIQARLLIRDLWGNPEYRNITGMKTIFLLGAPHSNKIQASVLRESELFHDIIQMNFRDTYDHLTLKTLSIFHWVKNFCPSAQWILKSDVDVFVNVFALSLFLDSRQENFVCILHPKPAVCHEKSKYCPEKWVIPREVYSRDQYPPYCRGPAYILNAEIVPKLFQLANKTHPFVMEDAYFTGILAEPMEPTYFHLGSDKFPFFQKDVNRSLRKLSFLLLNLEQFKRKEPPVLWNQVLSANNLTKQKIPGRAAKYWEAKKKRL